MFKIYYSYRMCDCMQAHCSV